MRLNDLMELNHVFRVLNSSFNAGGQHGADLESLERINVLRSFVASYVESAFLISC